MKPTIIEKIDEHNIDISKLDVACEILRQGGLVAFPTETVYGLGGDALNETAAARIYEAKGRPSDNPLIVHIANFQDVEKLADEVPQYAIKLMEKFWPGPLTLIFKKKNIVPMGTTGGLDTVAIRMPVHAVARELIRRSGVYIAAPSANISGKPSPTKGEHVIDDMNGRIDMIIDSGDVGIGLESTIIDVTGEVPVILRPGYITEQMIKDVTGNVEIDKAILEKPSPDLIPKAPGMKYKHYAPSADFTMIDGVGDALHKEVCNRVLEKVAQGFKVGIIATEEDIDLYKNEMKKAGAESMVLIMSIGCRRDEETIAHNLFAVLRGFDKSDVSFIYGETFPEDELGRAIMNRLSKAAGYNIIKID